MDGRDEPTSLSSFADLTRRVRVKPVPQFDPQFSTRPPYKFAAADDDDPAALARMNEQQA